VRKGQQSPWIVPDELWARIEPLLPVVPQQRLVQLLPHPRFVPVPQPPPVLADGTYLSRLKAPRKLRKDGAPDITVRVIEYRLQDERGEVTETAIGTLSV